MAAPKKTFTIPVSNGLLEHCSLIGQAVWLFLWCIDKTTKEKVDEKTGDRFGIVLGGMPVRDEDIAESLFVSARTIRVWRRKLARVGYIKIKRAPYGFIIKVAKSKKWKVSELQKSAALPKKESDRNLPLSLKENGTFRTENGTFRHESDQNARSNKTVQDITKTKQDGVNDSSSAADSKTADSDDVHILSDFFSEITGAMFEVNDRTATRLSAAIAKHGLEDVKFALGGFATDDHQWALVDNPSVLFLSRLDHYLGTPAESKS